MSDVGRNDPCPCGSGEKYKKCCLGRKGEFKDASDPSDVFADIHQALEGRDFASLDEANAFLADYSRQLNRQGREDFDGLSPEQMGSVLYHPFDSPQIATFPEILAEEPTAPILTLFGLLVDAIGEHGLKPTAKGNLPRAFCREAALAYWGEELLQERTRFGKINKEEDFSDLHVTRLVAEMAGLVRKYRGRFILGRECRRLLADHGLAGIYPKLLRAYIEAFNWGYRDNYPELDFIQHSFLFTLYLLQRHGGGWKPQLFYEDAFLRAFPKVLREVPDGSYFTPEELVLSCYTWRALQHFAGFLGLAEVEPTGTERFVRQFRIKKRPLLDAAVNFHL